MKEEYETVVNDMEFTVDITYNQKAFTAMARMMRKTIRRKRSLRSHIIGWLAIVLSFMFSVPGMISTQTASFKNIFTLCAALVMFIALTWEDKINGYFACKRMLPGTENATTIFKEDAYETVTDVGKSEWTYDKAMLLAETSDYFVFLFSPSHGQIYDKMRIAGGTVEEFRRFIEAKTGKMFQKI